MHIDSQFTVGIHTLMAVGFFEEDKMTSEKVARSIGCNPVIVRNVFSKLSKAGLLRPGMGNARTVLNRPADSITLLDVFKATQEEDIDGIFSMYPANLRCPIGGEIHEILSSRFTDAYRAMLDSFARTTIANLISELPSERNRLPEELR